MFSLIIHQWAKVPRWTIKEHGLLKNLALSNIKGNIHNIEYVIVKAIIIEDIVYRLLWSMIYPLVIRLPGISTSHL